MTSLFYPPFTGLAALTRNILESKYSLNKGWKNKWENDEEHRKHRKNYLREYHILNDSKRDVHPQLFR